MKKDTELEIFALCERLTELLGDKEAIADLKKLYDRHPEMFKDMQEVSQTIKEVVSETEIIRENPKAKNDKDFMLYKQLDNKKMADVGIKNDEGTNIIFHANKKNISKSSYFKKNKQMLVETPSAKAAPTRLSHCADKSSDLSRDSKVLSTSATDIIPHYPLTQEELQRRLDINLNNHRRVSDEKQKQEYLVRANAIKEQAKKQHIALDSKSLKALEKANLTKSNTNTKER